MAKSYRSHAAASLAAVLAVVVAAAPSAAQPVVQPLPGGTGRALDAALGRLARDPRDIGALIDAGNAALAMGDVDAATGFFRRADQVSPGNPRVKAGLAGAMVRNGDPFSAIPLFDEAERAGAGAFDSMLAADRGLAYDLVGDNATAQRYYRQSLAQAPNEEVTRRLSLSLAMAGDRQGAEQTLSPLLQQRNLAAWRTRAFSLAILGQTEESVNIANGVLPGDLAAGIAPYLRYMPRLTRAQQAAAANFGAFPRASEIGRDDPRVAQYASRRPAVATADAGLVPRGEPLGRNVRSRSARDRAAPREAASGRVGSGRTAVAANTRVAPPEVQPTREVASNAATVPAPVRPTLPAPAPIPNLLAAPTPAPAPAMARAPAPASPPAPSPAPTAAASAAVAMLPAPGFSLAPSAASPTPAPRPSPPPAAAAPPPPPPRSLRDAFAEFARPSIDVTPSAGAVDLRRIKPTRPKPEKPPEPPKPSHPSRIWVQVATGRDKVALGLDWRKMTRESAAVFRARQAFVSEWGRTNRLLTGPFESESAANAFIAQLRRAKVDGAFVWTSPAGQVVDPLGTGAAPARR